MGELFDIIEKTPLDWKILEPLYISKQLKHFLKKLLTKDPNKRPDISQVAKDPWLTGITTPILVLCCIKSSDDRKANKNSFQYKNQQEILSLNSNKAKSKRKKDLNK